MGARRKGGRSEDRVFCKYPRRARSRRLREAVRRSHRPSPDVALTRARGTAGAHRAERLGKVHAPRMVLGLIERGWMKLDPFRPARARSGRSYVVQHSCFPSRHLHDGHPASGTDEGRNPRQRRRYVRDRHGVGRRGRGRVAVARKPRRRGPPAPPAARGAQARQALAAASPDRPRFLVVVSSSRSGDSAGCIIATRG